MDIAPRYLPAGVQLSFSEEDPELDEFRYVPDHEIEALEAEIEALEQKKLEIWMMICVFVMDFCTVLRIWQK